MNEWLTPVVDAFTDRFGYVDSPVVWEVGSRDGHDGVELADRILASGTPQVHCIEANPAQAKIIKMNYPQANVIELAVSDYDGEAEFTVYHGDEGAVGSSSLNSEWKPGLENHKIKVQVKRLEDIIGTDEIDIMKIDVEGFSVQALNGLGYKIRQVKVYHIETESWHKTDDAVKKIMSEAGYELTDEREQYAGMPDLTFRRNN